MKITISTGTNPAKLADANPKRKGPKHPSNKAKGKGGRSINLDNKTKRKGFFDSLDSATKESYLEAHPDYKTESKMEVTISAFAKRRFGGGPGGKKRAKRGKGPLQRGAYQPGKEMYREWYNILKGIPLNSQLLTGVEYELTNVFENLGPHFDEETEEPTKSGKAIDTDVKKFLTELKKLATAKIKAEDTAEDLKYEIEELAVNIGQKHG